MLLQKYSDAFLDRTLLPLIPRSVSPNMVSWMRIASLPFIFFLLERESYSYGLALFVLAGLTDALDGALARTRDRITETGKVLDAVADRGLIALVALIFLPRFYGWWIVLLLGALEAANGVAAYRSKQKIGINPGANWAGKIKMIIQCTAFALIFLSLITGADGSLLSDALVLLIASALFAAIQTVSYPSTRAQAQNA